MKTETQRLPSMKKAKTMAGFTILDFVIILAAIAITASLVLLFVPRSVH